MSKVESGILWDTSQIARRFPVNFLVALVMVFSISCLHFAIIDHLPGWSTQSTDYTNHRMVSLDVIEDAHSVVAGFKSWRGAKELGYALELLRLDIHTLRVIGGLQFNAVVSAEVSNCGTFIATVSCMGDVDVYHSHDFRTCVQKLHLSLPGQFANSVVWSPDGGRLLVNYRTTSCLWNSSSGEKICEYATDYDSGSVSALSENCFYLATGGSCRIYRWSDGRFVSQLPIPAEATNVSISSDAKIFAFLRGANFNDSEVRVEEAASRSALHSSHCPVASSHPQSFVMSEDGRKVAYFSFDVSKVEYAIRVIDVMDSTEFEFLMLRQSHICGMQFVGRFIWVWTADGQIHKVNCDNGHTRSQLDTLNTLSRHWTAALHEDSASGRIEYAPKPSSHQCQ